MVGSPAISPTATRCRTAAPYRATGATMPKPSVVLWRVKPITRKAPRASSPRA